MTEAEQKARQAVRVSRILAELPSERKNMLLRRIAGELIEQRGAILLANAEDLREGEAKGMSRAMQDRLALNESRLSGMADGVSQLEALPDPVGEEIGAWKNRDGLRIRKVRVPLGVVGMIFEARPNVTVDAAALCQKTGNAVLLRGSSSALRSNAALVAAIQNGLRKENLPAEAVQLIEDLKRDAVEDMLRLHGLIDVIIPRGGAGLINFVVEKSRVPVLETGTGNCHVYVHEDAPPQMANSIVINAKTQRPSVCNAAESLLVHKDWAKKYLGSLIAALEECGVECRGCERTRAFAPQVKQAVEADWETEYLDYIIAVKVVDSLQEAIDHINRYGTRHTEAIVTEDQAAAEQFLRQVDAAAVFHNASTRFTDGFVFGFGAEIGISTQKLHARGPMGLPELTTYKYQIYGDGQVRG